MNKKERLVAAIEHGTVIDHIPAAKTYQVASLLGLFDLDTPVTIGFNYPSQKVGNKGIIKVSDKFFTDDEISRLSVVAPKVILNIIRDYEVVEKKTVETPEEIKGIVKCNNPKCITNNEPMATHFHVTDSILTCHYCEKEHQRQLKGIELIASENFVSDQVMEAMGSYLTNKYAEGYPGHRYYGGCQVVDEVEQLAIDRVCKLFGAEYANVQPHSGAQANAAVLLAVLKPGDTFMGMNLDHGGHLSHGSLVNTSGIPYKPVGYNLNKETGRVDYDEMERLAIENKPKLIIGGGSAYSREWDYKRMREIADKVGALLMIDMAHPAGLIAAGLLDNPVKYAHIVTSTTHKTLRGPRGGIILMGKDFDNPWGYTTPKGVVKKMSQLLNSAVFPGQQGGPLEHVIAAKAVAFGEALQPEFKEWAKQVQKNAKVLAEELIKRGFTIVSGGTDNHSMLVDLRSKYPDLTGKVAENALVAADITVNKNMVPFDSRSAFQTSGIRLGTPAITTRGAKEDLMVQIAEWIEEVLNDPENEQVIASVRQRVNEKMKDYPLFAY